MLRRVSAAIALCLLVIGCEPQSTGAPSTLPRGEGYDFFVLSLSWSPTHCELEGANANRQQCGASQRHGFIVHGLWPQNERGWPEYCESSEPNRVPDALVRDMLDLMPSAGLIGHQWRKHGSCSGMNQRDYFAVSRAAYEKVTIPAQLLHVEDHLSIAPGKVAEDFLAANPGLGADGIAVTCDGRHLAEVRICMTKDLAFRFCESVVARSCDLDRATMPPGGG